MFHSSTILIILASASLSQCKFNDWSPLPPPTTETTVTDEIEFPDDWSTPDAPQINVTTTAKPPIEEWTTPDAPLVTITTTSKPPPIEWTTPDAPLVTITTTLKPPNPDFTTPDAPIINITTTAKPPIYEWSTPDAPIIHITTTTTTTELPEEPCDLPYCINPDAPKQIL